MKKIEKKITEERQMDSILNALKGNDIKELKKLIKKGVKINIYDEFYWTPLHYACFYRQINVVKFLIDNGADIHAENATDKDKNKQETPLDVLKRRFPKAYKELMEWLADNHPEKALELMAHKNENIWGTEL